VLAGADEDLVAGDLVAAVGLRLGLGAQQAQVGAAVRLGQAHGAGPLAAGQLGQVQLLLLLGAVRVQRLVGAVRQAGYMVQAWLALLSISYTQGSPPCGRPWPPYSGSQDSAGQPPSTYCW
jgi:hypothetical protein